MICVYCEERDSIMTIPGETGPISLCEECLKGLFHNAISAPAEPVEDERGSLQ